ncbi:protein translocase SEC61 complex subunit gamma [Candidatus Woesearchaeota archaeon]|nr:protein translocase SEC61 complex subunit gamma [Candidatus Woesearchaeota archaeon]
MTDEQTPVAKDEEIEQHQETEQPHEEQHAVEPEAAAEQAPEKKELNKGILGQVKNIASPIPGKAQQLKSFITECKRVIRVTKKPDKEEFKTIVKISAAGMAIIGLLGFIIHFIKEIAF